MKNIDIDCSDGNIISEQRQKLVSALANNKDQILKQAITSVLGDDWCIGDLTGRGEFLILPDKTEVFKFDGMELVHFMIPETKIDNSITGMKVNVEQQYRFLNLAEQKGNLADQLSEEEKSKLSRANAVALEFNMINSSLINSLQPPQK